MFSSALIQPPVRKGSDDHIWKSKPPISCARAPVRRRRKLKRIHRIRRVLLRDAHSRTCPRSTNQDGGCVVGGAVGGTHSTAAVYNDSFCFIPYCVDWIESLDVRGELEQIPVDFGQYRLVHQPIAGKNRCGEHKRGRVGI
ncbi:uncharacterized protein LOC144018515 [Festucalex cinctus]